MNQTIHLPNVNFFSVPWKPEGQNTQKSKSINIYFRRNNNYVMKCDYFDVWMYHCPV